MPIERPLLYTYRRCPYAMRARMALLVAGVAFDAHEIELRNKPAALLKASAKGTVPVLVGPQGLVLEQSWDIVQWALTQPKARSTAMDWWHHADTPDLQGLLQLNDGQFKHHLDRYKYPERYEMVSPDEKTAIQREHRQQAMELLLMPLEDRLQDQPFLAGQAPCAADIGIFPFVRQFAAVDVQWFESLPLVNVKAWLQRWVTSALFGACMIKLPANTATTIWADDAHAAAAKVI